ncbi:MAG: hypothetical protein OEM46_00635 [Ignavibacteria bacterium]|nr:hypothetical protein [Ignavibacteria bacterium]
MAIKEFKVKVNRKGFRILKKTNSFWRRWKVVTPILNSWSEVSEALSILKQGKELIINKEGRK